MNGVINVGVIGFGLSGRYFFSPFFEVHPEFQLKAIVSSQKELVLSEYPKVEVYSEPNDLFHHAGIDLIVVASPNATHVAYTRQALNAGKHVVVEKPFTITSEEADELIKLSGQKGKVLAPFQNRRWDGDFLTLKKIVEDKQLGELLEFESSFNRYRPNHDPREWKRQSAPGSGVLFDLGPHLIDQALVLFGLPSFVYGDIRIQREGGVVDDYFEVQLYYSRLKVILKAGVFVKEPGPRYILHGRKGSFVKYGIDPQENNLRKGIKPNDKHLGQDTSDFYGILAVEENGEGIRKKIETIPGDYRLFFDNVASTIYGKTNLQVQPEQAKQIIKVIEKAYESNRKKQALPFE